MQKGLPTRINVLLHDLLHLFLDEMRLLHRLGPFTLSQRKVAREKMGFKQITSLQEAKERGIRALVVITCATGMLSFGYVLYDSWEEGPVTAIGFAILLTIIVVVLMGGALPSPFPELSGISKNPG